MIQEQRRKSSWSPKYLFPRPRHVAYYSCKWDAKVIRVILPQHLRTLAHVGSEVQLELDGPVTLRSVLDALEARYPMLRGTIRDQVTQQRRPFLRFFACEEDLSHEPPDAPLPDAIASGKEPFIIIGAIAGG
jgi:sulfur-carrier protein